MNEEELTYGIPNNQIHISKEKDEDCLIWISSKAINMANTIEELQQENKQLKDNWNKIEQIIENERMSHWAPSPLFLTELLSKMQELEKSEINEE